MHTETSKFNKKGRVNDDTTLYKVRTIADVPGPVMGMTVSADDIIYCTIGNQIYSVQNQKTFLYAGSSDTGLVDGGMLTAKFGTLGRIDIDADNNLYVCDNQYKKIRKIDKDGNVSTLFFPFWQTIYDKYDDSIGKQLDTLYTGPPNEVHVKNNFYIATTGGIIYIQAG